MVVAYYVMVEAGHCPHRYGVMAAGPAADLQDRGRAGVSVDYYFHSVTISLSSQRYPGGAVKRKGSYIADELTDI
jgi:hypothetical protein